MVVTPAYRAFALPYESRNSNALKRLGFRSRNFLARLLSETSRACNNPVSTISLSLEWFDSSIADVTDPKSIPQEPTSIVPNLPSVPVQPLLQNGFEPWGMYDQIERYPWVLPLVPYENQEALLTALPLKVLLPK